MSNEKRNYIDADFERKSSRKKGKTKVEWDEVNLKTVETLAGLGLNEAQIAANFNLHPNSFTNYKKQFPQLIMAIEKGKAKAITNVAKSAYEMAVSKEHPSMTQFWLKNRAKDQWADKQTIEHSGQIEGSSASERVAEILVEVLDYAKETKTVEPIQLEDKEAKE